MWRRSPTGPRRRHTTPTSTFTGLLREPRVLGHPVVAFDRLAKALGDDPRRAEVIEVGNEEAELVAAEAGVELLAGAELGRLLRDEVVGPDLLAEQTRDAVDDAVAQRVTERVVVPLERGDVDQAHRAPLAALLEREERLELLDEAPEVHQPGLRIAVHAIGQVGDEVLEVLARCC